MAKAKSGKGGLSPFTAKVDKKAEKAMGKMPKMPMKGKKKC